MLGLYFRILERIGLEPHELYAFLKSAIDSRSVTSI